jgi:histidinol-phosphate aminotransferase
VARAIRSVRLDRYPDPDCTALLEALSEKLSIPADWIVPGNGATELIHAAARAWSGPDRTIAHRPPTFGEYAAAARVVGAAVVPYDELLGDLFPASRLSLLFLCNPNNPTGELMSHAGIVRAHDIVAPGMVVLDESFIQLVDGVPTALPLLEEHPNLVIIRSMTKDYGLTALRLGYAVGRPELIGAIRRQLPPWTVNGLAQAAGVAALMDQRHLDVTLGRLRAAKRALVDALELQGWRLLVGEANFVLVEVGRATVVRQQLARQGLLVRDCQSFGMPEYIRIAVRRPDENQRLVAALSELRVGGYPRAREKDVQ